jgi:hypothetical protein
MRRLLRFTLNRRCWLSAYLRLADFPEGWKKLCWIHGQLFVSMPRGALQAGCWVTCSGAIAPMPPVAPTSERRGLGVIR